MGSVLHTSTDQVVLASSQIRDHGTNPVASMGGSDIWIVKLDDSRQYHVAVQAGTVFTGLWFQCMG